ncbi:type II secretion system minor pseudopilin GspK [Pseudomonas luteola]|uniref:type II secretion system minor pseudopilin GspK n=1 Tax=Pseudomonas luteola TaxID=47886 RepID=UPI0038908EE2
MRKEQGVALIMVLLIVAMVTAICSGIIYRQQLSIRSSSNQITSEQIWQYALGGEALGQAVLSRDLKQSGNNFAAQVDHLNEEWAKPLPIFPIDQGEISIQIEDLSGRLNVNGLVQNGVSDSVTVERFKRLLSRLKISRPYAEKLVDWLDANQDPVNENGAEDIQYQQAQPPYRTADREIQDVSELRLLLGMTESDYQRLLPFIAAIPSGTPLNVNTASAMVLSCLSDALDGSAVKALIAERGVDGYKDIRSFLDQEALGGTGLKGVGLAVNSSYFQVTSDIRLGDRHQVLSSTLQRNAIHEIRVLKRDLSQPGRIIDSSSKTP